MSEIKTLEDMRNTVKTIAADCDEGWILGCLDDIEAEIAERFMELPVDADGVPIKPGDIMQFRDDAPVRVDSIGNSKCYVGDFGWFGGNGGFYGKGTLKCCRHVKQRTLEDVLREFTEKYQYCISDNGRSITLAEYADEIRELLGVGE